MIYANIKKEVGLERFSMCITWNLKHFHISYEYFADKVLLHFPKRDTKQNNNNSADTLKTICPSIQLPEALGNGLVSFSAHNSTNYYLTTGVN